MGKKIIGVTVGTPIKPDLVGGGSDVDLSEYVKNTDYENNKSRYVKEGLTANTETLTKEEKEKACEWVGAIPLGTTEGEISGYNHVYGRGSSGQPIVIPYSWQTNTNTIVIRDVGGTIKTGTPTDDLHATNKAYVDNAIGNIETTLDNIIAIQENLIGGGNV